MVLALVLLVLLAVTALVIWIGAGDVLMDRFYASAAPAESPLPPILFPFTSDHEPVVAPAPIGFAAPIAAPIAAPPGSYDGTPYVAAPHTPAPPPARPMRGTPITYGARPYTSGPAIAPTLAAAGLAIADSDEVDEAPVPLTGETVVFRRIADEPLQLLPGRFEVLAGEPGREDVRFFGALGEPVEIVLGREGGPPQRAIRLHSRTVSRRHARLTFANGHWTITNLSTTNPVVVNDDVLAPSLGESRVLADGDRVELGEVVLRFHAR